MYKLSGCGFFIWAERAIKFVAPVMVNLNVASYQFAQNSKDFREFELMTHTNLWVTRLKFVN